MSRYYSIVDEDKILKKIEWAEKLILEVNAKRLKEKLKPIRSPNFRNLNKKQIIELLGLTAYESISLLKPKEYIESDNQIIVEESEYEKEKKLKKKEYLIRYKEKVSNEEYYFLKQKISFFKKRSPIINDFTYIDVINKFGKNPQCYLTGLPIDYNDKKSYQLDHFISVSKGGSSELENLRLANPLANYMKSGHDMEKFLNICELITEYNKTILTPTKCKSDLLYVTLSECKQL